MRLPVLAALTLLILPAPALAADPPNARAAYVERRGLVEVDAQCRLFTSGMRQALQAGAMQARGALLRSGWSTAQVRELESAVVAAAHARQCADDRTTQSAAEARTAFGSWINSGSMEFPGWQRTWVARRVVASDGWRLRQSIDAPVLASFGVRDHNGAQRIVLTIPIAQPPRAPMSAQLSMRDAARAPLTEVSLPERVAYGLEAGVAAPNAALSMPSIRTIERLNDGAQQMVFTFPDLAFQNLLALDPRETVEIRLVSGRSTQRLLVEVGDVAVARAFLTIRGN